MQAVSSLTMDSGSMEAHLQVLRDRLEATPPLQRVAFAAGMVERLTPFSLELDRLNDVSTAATIGTILNRLWLHVSGNALLPDEVTQLTADCVDLDLGDDVSHICWIATVAASRAAVSALDICVNPADSVANAVEAAERVIEIVDHHIFNRPGQVFSAELSTQFVIDADPLMVMERMTQMSLLRFLQDPEPFGQGQIGVFRSRLRPLRIS